MRFGEFEILGRIAIGGMGEVFRARKKGGKDVALKLIRADLLADPHFHDLFVAEAQVGVLLDHPNVVRTVEFGEISGVPFMAQELVDGVTLERLLSDGPLPAAVAVHVVLELLSGLAYAHAVTDDDGRPLRLVHRDVSVANVLVSRSGEVKLTDFGVAKLRGRSLTDAGEVKGKRDCMAPEQMMGGRTGAHVDLRADIFASGVLLHAVLHGHGPFDDVERWLRSGMPLADDEMFSEVLHGALAVDPDDRYASAPELARAIAQVMHPAEDAREQLSMRVRSVINAHSPLGKLDRLILNAFAESDRHPFKEEDTAPNTPIRLLPLIPSGQEELPTDPIPILSSSELQLDLTPVPHEPKGRGYWPLIAGLGALTVIAGIAAGFLSAGDPTSVDPLPPAHAPAAAAPPAPAPTPVAAPPVVAPPIGAPAAGAPAAGTSAVGAPAPAASAAGAPAAGAPAAVAPAAVAPPFVVPTVVAAQVAVAPVARRVPVPEASDDPDEEPVRARPTPRAAPPPSKPRAPVADGSLTLDSDPWASAYLNGRKLGTTPFSRVALPAGKHTLMLDAEDRGKRKPVVVLITPGAERRIVLHLDR